MTDVKCGEHPEVPAAWRTRASVHRPGPMQAPVVTTLHCQPCFKALTATQPTLLQSPELISAPEEGNETAHGQ